MDHGTTLLSITIHAMVKKSAPGKGVSSLITTMNIKLLSNEMSTVFHSSLYYRYMSDEIALVKRFSFSFIWSLCIMASAAYLILIVQCQCYKPHNVNKYGAKYQLCGVWPSNIIIIIITMKLLWTNLLFPEINPRVVKITFPLAYKLKIMICSQLSQLCNHHNNHRSSLPSSS